MRRDASLGWTRVQAQQRRGVHACARASRIFAGRTRHALTERRIVTINFRDDQIMRGEVGELVVVVVLRSLERRKVQHGGSDDRRCVFRAGMARIRRRAIDVDRLCARITDGGLLLVGYTRGSGMAPRRSRASKTTTTALTTTTTTATTTRTKQQRRKSQPQEKDSQKKAARRGDEDDDFCFHCLAACTPSLLPLLRGADTSSSLLLLL